VVRRGSALVAGRRSEVLLVERNGRLRVVEGIRLVMASLFGMGGVVLVREVGVAGRRWIHLDH
jgi:hypothetical protein